MISPSISQSQAVAAHAKDYSGIRQVISSNSSPFSSDTGIKGQEFFPSVAQQQILLADAGTNRPNDNSPYGSENTNPEASTLGGIACGLSLYDANPLTSIIICGAVGYGMSKSDVQLPQSDFDPHGQPWDDTDYGVENND